jgi:hypothetical protein
MIRLTVEAALEKIEDPHVRAFLAMELERGAANAKFHRERWKALVDALRPIVETIVEEME